MSDFMKGDRVRVAVGKEGIVFRAPREDATNICVLLDGVKTPQYFPASELSIVRSPAVFPELEPKGVFTPAADVPADRQMTIAELVELRTKLRANLSQFEEQIEQLQRQDAVASTLGKLFPDLDRDGPFTLEAAARLVAKRSASAVSILSREATAEAIKIKTDTAIALAAARRLFPS